MLRKSFAFVILILFLFLPQIYAADAFPGAEGYGKGATGGRGGKIIQVTNLNDSGPGSLRDCVKESGKRICVFTVGGTITLDKRINIDTPNITVAAQTAPGGGITLRTSDSLTDAPMRINTENVVIRGIRLRPGPSKQPSHSVDALQVLTGGDSVMIDHVSLSWATDETFSTWYTAKNVTVQDSIVGEPLHWSSHEETIDRWSDPRNHGLGILLGGGSSRVSVLHNFLPHNFQRNPTLNIGERFDFIGNAVHNPGFPTSARIKSGSNRVNLSNIYVKLGQNAESMSEGFYLHSSVNDFYINNIEIYDDIGRSITSKSGIKIERDGDTGVENPYSNSDYSTPSQNQIYDNVINNAGAGFRVSCSGELIDHSKALDIVDIRLKSWFKSGGGRWIDAHHVDYAFSDSLKAKRQVLGDNQTLSVLTEQDYIDAGIPNPKIDNKGWPILDAGTPCEDKDKDSIPDLYELKWFDSLSTLEEASKDSDKDGYPDFEEYLNATNPTSSNNSLIYESSEFPTPTVEPTEPTPSPSIDLSFDHTGDGVVDIRDILELVKYIFR